VSDDPYAVLGVDRRANADDVRRAYLRLVRVHTPESNPEQFKRVRTAYDTLRSPLRRAELAVQAFDETVSEPDLDLVAALGDDELDVVALLLAAEVSGSDVAATDFAHDMTPIREADLLP
jgi:curved DNA-binding protein CbpA